jgi:hypothetical protein
LTPNRSNKALAWADRPIKGELAPITASMLPTSAWGALASGARWPDSSFSLPSEINCSSACGTPSRISVSPGFSTASGSGADRLSSGPSTAMTLASPWASSCRSEIVLPATGEVSVTSASVTYFLAARASSKDAVDRVRAGSTR